MLLGECSAPGRDTKHDDSLIRGGKVVDARADLGRPRLAVAVEGLR